LSKLPISACACTWMARARWHALHELLLNATASITLRPDDMPQVPPVRLPASALRPVGFDDDDALLDYDPRSFLGYRLIQEYFVLPEKFLFVDLTGIDTSRFDRAMEVTVELGSFGRPERLPRLEQAVSAETFRLFCTPIVNLFKQRASRSGCRRSATNTRWCRTCAARSGWRCTRWTGCASPAARRAATTWSSSTRPIR
jgi:type VI protein secretion system component VasA